MITLSNGDKWVLGEFEWENVDIPYEEACKGELPIMSNRDFVRNICEYYSSKEYPDIDIDPRKWTSEFDGYWDANFDVFGEVFPDVAVRQIDCPWADVYEMPWGEVLVVFKKPDSGGYDCRVVVEVYKDQREYMKQVAFT